MIVYVVNFFLYIAKCKAVITQPLLEDLKHLITILDLFEVRGAGVKEKGGFKRVVLNNSRDVDKARIEGRRGAVRIWKEL